jgi:hypothetical protein
MYDIEIFLLLPLNMGVFYLDLLNTFFSSKHTLSLIKEFVCFKEKMCLVPILIKIKLN